MSSSDSELLHPLEEEDSPELPFGEALPSALTRHAQKIFAPWCTRSSDPGLVKNAALTYNRRAHGYRLSVVVLTTSFQYSLPLIYSIGGLLNDEIPQLKDYLPRSRLELMKHSFWSLVAREPGLRQLARNLREMGKPLIGDVIQMTEEDLIAAAFATPREISLLRDTLDKAELSLGTKIANWSSKRNARGL